MKKFLSLLTVFMLAFALAIPVGATDEEFHYNGIDLPNVNEVWTDKATYPYAYIQNRGSTYWLILSKGVGVYKGENDVVEIPNGTSVLVYDAVSGSASWAYKSSYSGCQVGSVNAPIAWTNETIYGLDGTPFFSATLPVTDTDCDGSSCPAVDVNTDGICDDCGRAFALLNTSETYEIVVKHADGTTLRFSFTETVADTVFDAVYRDNRITVSFDNAVNHNQYKLTDGEWTDYASYPNIYDYHSINFPEGATILSSDLNIYDENGDLFFRNPLWMEMEKVTQGEMTGLVQETAGTMKTLVVCGVGLMACLMALSLFGKRYLLFLR